MKNIQPSVFKKKDNVGAVNRKNDKLSAKKDDYSITNLQKEFKSSQKKSSIFGFLSRRRNKVSEDDVKKEIDTTTSSAQKLDTISAATEEVEDQSELSNQDESPEIEKKKDGDMLSNFVTSSNEDQKKIKSPNENELSPATEKKADEKGNSFADNNTKVKTVVSVNNEGVEKEIESLNENQPSSASGEKADGKECDIVDMIPAGKNERIEKEMESSKNNLSSPANEKKVDEENDIADINSEVDNVAKAEDLEKGVDVSNDKERSATEKKADEKDSDIADFIPVVNNIVIANTEEVEKGFDVANDKELSASEKKADKNLSDIGDMNTKHNIMSNTATANIGKVPEESISNSKKRNNRIGKNSGDINVNMKNDSITQSGRRIRGMKPRPKPKTTQFLKNERIDQLYDRRRRGMKPRPKPRTTKFMKNDPLHRLYRNGAKWKFNGRKPWERRHKMKPRPKPRVTRFLENDPLCRLSSRGTASSRAQNWKRYQEEKRRIRGRNMRSRPKPRTTKFMENDPLCRLSSRGTAATRAHQRKKFEGRINFRAQRHPKFGQYNEPGHYTHHTDDKFRNYGYYQRKTRTKQKVTSEERIHRLHRLYSEGTAATRGQRREKYEGKKEM